MPLNDDPGAMSDEEYNATYEDPDINLHQIPADVLERAYEALGVTDEQ